MPLPRKVMLLYSDCCVGTYFPDNFCSCQPVFNHNTPTSHVIFFVCPYEISSVFSLPQQDCVCIFTSCPLFESAFFSHTCVSHAPYLLFQPFFYCQNFSKFCRIHLKFPLPFHIPYLASIFIVFTPLVW
jgi:hypothetical protein